MKLLILAIAFISCVSVKEKTTIEDVYKSIDSYENGETDGVYYACIVIAKKGVEECEKIYCSMLSEYTEEKYRSVVYRTCMGENLYKVLSEQKQ